MLSYQPSHPHHLCSDNLYLNYRECLDILLPLNWAGAWFGFGNSRVVGLLGVALISSKLYVSVSSVSSGSLDVDFQRWEEDEEFCYAVRR